MAVLQETCTDAARPSTCTADQADAHELGVHSPRVKSLEQLAPIEEAQPQLPAYHEVFHRRPQEPPKQSETSSDVDSQGEPDNGEDAGSSGSSCQDAPGPMSCPGDVAFVDSQGEPIETHLVAADAPDPGCSQDEPIEAHLVAADPPNPSRRPGDVALPGSRESACAAGSHPEQAQVGARVFPPPLRPCALPARPPPRAPKAPKVQARSEKLGAKMLLRLYMLAPWPFFILGVPCVTGWPSHAFRCTCVGFASFSALAYNLPPGRWRDSSVQVAMSWNSISSWIISAWWCAGQVEWIGLMTIEHIFMAVGIHLLLGRNVIANIMFTAVGSALGYYERDWLMEIAASSQRRLAEQNTMSGREWAVRIIVMVVALVGGMLLTGYVQTDAMKRYWALLRGRVCDVVYPRRKTSNQIAIQNSHDNNVLLEEAGHTVYGNSSDSRSQSENEDPSSAVFSSQEIYQRLSTEDTEGESQEPFQRHVWENISDDFDAYFQDELDARGYFDEFEDLEASSFGGRSSTRAPSSSESRAVSEASGWSWGAWSAGTSGHEPMGV